MTCFSTVGSIPNFLNSSNCFSNSVDFTSTAFLATSSANATVDAFDTRTIPATPRLPNLIDDFFILSIPSFIK